MVKKREGNNQLKQRTLWQVPLNQANPVTPGRALAANSLRWRELNLISHKVDQRMIHLPMKIRKTRIRWRPEDQRRNLKQCSKWLHKSRYQGTTWTNDEKYQAHICGCRMNGRTWRQTSFWESGESAWERAAPSPKSSTNLLLWPHRNQSQYMSPKAKSFVASKLASISLLLAVRRSAATAGA